MRLWRLCLASGVALAIPLLTTATAGASLDEPCAASGTIVETGETHDARTADDIEIPSEGQVAWEGSVPEGDGERSISGFVKIDLPAPIPDVTAGDWESESSTYSNSGTYDYELPSVLEGFDVRVYGEHNDAGFSCAGEVTVKLEGGGIGNPLTIASLVFTIISALGLFLWIGVL